MLSALFKVKPIIDEASKEWIFDTFAWCMAQMNGEYFQPNQQLILTDMLYPQNLQCVEAIADKVLTKTNQYIGMSNTAISLTPVKQFYHTYNFECSVDDLTKPTRKPFFSSTLYREHYQARNATTANENNNIPLEIGYHESQLNQPDTFIAYLVEKQLTHIVKQQGVNPPTRKVTLTRAVDDKSPHKQTLTKTVDLIACFMGFGVIFSRAASHLQSESNVESNKNKRSEIKNVVKNNIKPKVSTNTALINKEHTEEIIYALALFCAIKNSDTKVIKQELTTDLYKLFNKAYKEVSLYLQQTTNPVHMLKQINSSAAISSF
ncbi:hypothetical protein [Colwellia echini]|uniref:Uncharacterized protein n=1 Tax=Colwellia echini TaxID=1982103 RepID=A0ABY3N1M2_9GAMM|nr:hypothetical protein [Colwellia echini]TYK67398.1 hypothetical protein CWS31_002415 [Colwellia echini]